MRCLIGGCISYVYFKNEFRLFLIENKSVLADWFDKEACLCLLGVYMADIGLNLQSQSLTKKIFKTHL